MTELAAASVLVRDHDSPHPERSRGSALSPLARVRALRDLALSLTRAADRVPCFANLSVNPKRSWAGLYEMTPDHHPILGEAPEVRGFYLANGFSGHGVMHAPATGKIVSDLILTGKTEMIDASLLNLSRFAEGRTIHETAVL